MRPAGSGRRARSGARGTAAGGSGGAASGSGAAAGGSEAAGPLAAPGGAGPSSPLGALHAAFAFLTRLPLPRLLPGPGALEASVAWFPAVGAVVGGLAALGLLAAAWLWPSPLPALAAVAIAVAATGGFHEDGLADTADAFAAGGDLERRLRVMDDPRIGAVGAVVLVLALLGRVAALALLPLTAAAAALIAAHTLARWSVPALLWRLPYVRGEAGIAARLKRGATGGRLAAATALTLLVLAVAALGSSLLPAALAGAPLPVAADRSPQVASPAAELSPIAPGGPPAAASPATAGPPESGGAGLAARQPWRSAAALAAAAAAAALLVTLAAGAVFRRRFGGVTGDLLGAACQAVELAVVLAVLAVVHRGW